MTEKTNNIVLRTDGLYVHESEIDGETRNYYYRFQPYGKVDYCYTSALPEEVIKWPHKGDGILEGYYRITEDEFSIKIFVYEGTDIGYQTTDGNLYIKYNSPKRETDYSCYHFISEEECLRIAEEKDLFWRAHQTELKKSGYEDLLQKMRLVCDAHKNDTCYESKKENSLYVSHSYLVPIGHEDTAEFFCTCQLSLVSDTEEYQNLEWNNTWYFEYGPLSFPCISHAESGLNTWYINKPLGLKGIWKLEITEYNKAV